MAHAYEIPVTIAGTRVDAQVHGHLVRTDQPYAKGGKNSAPSPYDMFLASIGTCAGAMIQAFCARRDIPADDIRLVQRVAFDDNGELSEISIELSLPATFPEKYIEVLQKVVEQCPVEHAIRTQPIFLVAHRREHLQKRTQSL